MTPLANFCWAELEKLVSTKHMPVWLLIQSLIAVNVRVFGKDLVVISYYNKSASSSYSNRLEKFVLHNFSSRFYTIWKRWLQLHFPWRRKYEGSKECYSSSGPSSSRVKRERASSSCLSLQMFLNATKLLWNLYISQTDTVRNVQLHAQTIWRWYAKY